MLPTPLLLHRYNGEEVVPKRLALNTAHLETARDIIRIFDEARGKRRGELDEQLQALEGEDTDYRVKRGLAHLLAGFCTFETISPIDPAALRERVFALSATHVPDPKTTTRLLKEVAEGLSRETGQNVNETHVQGGLYADLRENQLLTSFDPPSPEALLNRYNLAQVQGVLYRASEITLTAHRNVPGEYKQLFRYLKLFGLMTTVEGDAEHGFTITIDGPTSLFGASTRYGTDLAKFLPALLHVSHWRMVAELTPRQSYDGVPDTARLSLEADCNLVSHYKKGAPYDSILEQAFASRWAALETTWQLEREVNIVALPGSVMIPDFRLVHPDGREYVFEIVGYWRPEYLRRKFAQVRKAEQDNIILAVSEKLNLEKAGVKLDNIPAKIVWFKEKINPKDVLAVLE